MEQEISVMVSLELSCWCMVEAWHAGLWLECWSSALITTAAADYRISKLLGCAAGLVGEAQLYHVFEA